MGTPKLDTEIRKEQIAQAALSLVAGQGLRAITIERVARLVGLVPSALYRHFKNKDQVLDAVLDLIRRRLLDNVQASREETADPVDSLRRLLMRHIRLILEYQAIPRILFSDDVYSGRPERRAKLHDIVTTFLGQIAQIIQAGQRQKTIRRDVSAETLSVMFLGMFQPSAMLYFLSHGKFDMVKHADRAWKVFSESIRSKPT